MTEFLLSFFALPLAKTHKMLQWGYHENSKSEVQKKALEQGVTDASADNLRKVGFPEKMWGSPGEFFAVNRGSKMIARIEL